MVHRPNLLHTVGGKAMAWELRRGRRYFYRGVRYGARVKKIYYGNGVTSRLAAEMDVKRRVERQIEARAWESEKAHLAAAQDLTQNMQDGCDLLVSAVLLAAGLHRQNRQPWRVWN